MLRKKIKLATANESSEIQSDSNLNEKTTKKTHKKSQTNNAITTSPFFESAQFWQKLYDIECRLSVELKAINFLSSNISAVYNPIEYAADLHCAYLKKFCDTPKTVLFIGMNPGPFGMVQTGVKTITFIIFKTIKIDFSIEHSNAFFELK